MAGRIKKKRIARIGNMSSAQGTANMHCDEGLEQADCNLVYNIMQSMDKSQNPMTYQQLTELRSKKKISRTNNGEQQNKKSLNSKHMKKMVPEKAFPLMAKCQKSMKYLKKNRCIPKPRAHVGSVLRIPQISSLNCNSNFIYNKYNASSNIVNHEKSSMKRKQYSKKGSSEMNANRKEAKISLSLDICRDNTFEEEPMLIDETDSDSEFEQFIEKHHPEKGASSYISDSSVNRRKGNKSKRKRKQLVCATKITKVTSKKLSDFEESAESGVENNHKNITGESNSTENSYSRQFPSRKFHRIIKPQTSDDSASDAHLNDFGVLNHDSFDSSEDENMIIKSPKKKNRSIAPDLNDFECVDILSAEPNSVTLSALSEPKNNLNCDILESKCIKPCFVSLKRDPLLDQKAASLHTDNSSVTNSVVVSKLDDDGDCIIICELPTVDNSHESESIRQSFENGNRCRENSTDNAESPVSEALPEVDSTQNKCMLTEKLIYGSNNISPQTEANPLISNQKSIKNISDDKSMEVQRDEKEVFRNVVPSIKSQSDIEKGEKYIVNEVSKHSDKNINSAESEEKSSSPVNSISQHISELPKDETGVSLKNDRSTSVEKEIFKVQILSVKSLNESDIIILSDDDEEKGSETRSTVNVTKESASEDSDVEIICLDSSIDKKKYVGEDLKDVLNNKIHNKVENGLKGDSSSSTNPVILDEEDCIILDDVDLLSEKHSAKTADTVQQSSRVNVMSDGMINDEKMNSNKNRETISGKEQGPENSILKILDTIDFNSIKKVLSETATIDNKNVKNSDSILAKTENSLYGDIQTSEKEKTADSFPGKLEQSHNYIRPQKQTGVDANITPVGSSALNIKSLKTSLVDTQKKHFELPQNYGVSRKIIKNDSENFQGPNSNNIPSSGDSVKSSSFLSSSSHFTTTFTASKICDKEIIASNHKTEPDTLLHSRKNQQLVPAYPKMEKYESPSDELDIIAAKSIQNLDEREKVTILPLLDLYRAEYKKFMEIKCTEKNVTAGLRLLEDKQTKKLNAISSSIKNLVKKDGCFHKVNKEFGSNQSEHKSFIKSNSAKKDESSEEIKKPLDYKSQPANSNCFEIEKDDKVRIFHPSVVETASEVLKLKSVGPSSSQEVYNHLINSVCAECGKNAVAACNGCAKIFYCSEKCGMSFWNKGHDATCRR